MDVANVLGETREVRRTYADGSFDCPFCSNGVIAPATECDNPWCEANPRQSTTWVLEQRAKREAEVKRIEEYKRLEEWRRQYARESEQARVAWEQEQIEEAKRKGACLNCLFPFPGTRRVKFIRHRSECTKQR